MPEEVDWWVGVLEEGRVKADGLGRWVRDWIGGWRAGSGLSSDDASGLVACGLIMRDGLVAVLFGIGVMEVASKAASSSLSSWYLRRLSSGRTPFSM